MPVERVDVDQYDLLALTDPDVVRQRFPPSPPVRACCWPVSSRRCSHS